MARFSEFIALSEKLPVVSLADIRAAMPELRRETLYRWHRAGKIEIIAPGFYSPRGSIQSEEQMFAVANRIYRPSFVSLQSALAHHGLAAEVPLAVTSVTSAKTRTVHSPSGQFIYRTVKPERWFGYMVEQGIRFSYLMASPERAIADVLYLSPRLNSPADLIELRLDPQAFEKLAVNLEETVEKYRSKALVKRCRALREAMENA